MTTKTYFTLPFSALLLALLLSGCGQSTPEEKTGDVADPVADALAITEEFVAGFYSQFPEDAVESGYPNAPTDHFSHRREADIAAWNAKVSAWLIALQAIDAKDLAGSTAAIPHEFALDRLQALQDRSVCRMDAWNVNPTWTGWQFRASESLAAQAIGSDAERQAALAKFRDLARLIDDQREILFEGMRRGFRAANSNVEVVIQQMDALIASNSEESPLLSPANRSADEGFKQQWRVVYNDEVLPAIERHRDFLADEYEGREEVGVAANPNGRECYTASVRYWSSLAMTPEDIHRKGLSEMARIQSEMQTIARRSFATDNVKELLNTLRTDPQYTFASEQAVLDYAKAAIARGKQEVVNWFGFVPEVALDVVPSAAYEKDSGGGYYSVGPVDGSRPATYRVGTYNPRGISKAGLESTAFHESYPGHHLQGIVATRVPGLHSIQRYISVSGASEGWGLYAERLADEMGLYSSDLDRIGMLSNEAYRAARLVIDPGMHVMGWTREEAIQYMMDNTTEGIDAATSEIDRYIAVPGQATSYLLGSLEIQRLRKKAENILGAEFDIKAFHDRVLSVGSVPLPMLRESIDSWIEEQPAGSE